jgi:5,10-methylenetetrahydromethanopterin reductase
MFDRDRRPEELVPFAREVEDMGLDELWVVEDCFWTGGITSATAALVATERLTVGLGIAPAPARNPALLAMEVANLARIAPGRFVCGIGHGVQSWMEQIGERVTSPLTLLDETISSVRSILRGEDVSVDGRYVHLDGVRLVHPPAVVPPVVAGVVQPKSLRLAGRVADGTILCEGITPGRIADAVAHIDAGRADAGRTDQHHLVVFAFLCVDADPAAARDRVAGLIEHVAQNQHLPPDDEMVIWGTPAMCAEQVHRFAAAGAEALAFRPVGDDPSGQVRAVLAALA